MTAQKFDQQSEMSNDGDTTSKSRWSITTSKQNDVKPPYTIKCGIDPTTQTQTSLCNE